MNLLNENFISTFINLLSRNLCGKIYKHKHSDIIFYICNVLYYLVLHTIEYFKKHITIEIDLNNGSANHKCYVN